MLIIRSPTLTFALIFTICSISLTIATSLITDNEVSNNSIHFLIIGPPLNCIFVFLLTVTWTERRFRLTYIPFICLCVIIAVCLTVTIIASSFLSLSIIMYINLVFYGLFSILFLTITIIVLISYAYGSLFIHRNRNMMTREQQHGEMSNNIEPLHIDKLTLKSSNDEELILFMSKLPGRRIRHDIRNIEDDLNQIQAHTIITLNESKELSFMNMTNQNQYDMDTYKTCVKRANIQHILYPIRDRFIPKSISDYLQFIYAIVIDANSAKRNHILVHCMGGMGRTGMTVICLELVYEYLTKTIHEQKNNQRFIERIFHYPFLLTNSCRVCQAIANVRQTRPGTIHNPLQILFIHEFYARLKSSMYMRQIKKIFDLNEKLLARTNNDLNSHMMIPNERRSI